MTIRIDAKAAIQALREAVAERGEGYVYPGAEHPEGCRYYHEEDQAPGCLVGLALHKLGVPTEALEALEGTAAFMLCRLEFDEVLNGVEIAQKAALVFDAAQTRQDKGQTWGESLRSAEAHMEHQGLSS